MSDTLRQSQILQCKYDFKNDKYLTFIAEIRDLVRDNNRTSHGCHILPLEEEADPLDIDLKLQEGGIDKGLVKIRRYDLRMINYQDPFGNSLDVNEFQLYDDDSRLVNFGIEDLKLGLSTFLEAVNYLSNINKKFLGTSFLVMCDKKKFAYPQEKVRVRTSLVVLCLVICESTKVDLFSCILSNAFELGFEVPLSPWLLDRINDWGFFSEQLLSYELHESDTSKCNGCLPNDMNNWHDERRVIGVTCHDVVKFLGIIKAFPPDFEPIKEECLLDGMYLVEVFSVSVYFSDGQSGSAYGSIIVKTDFGSFSIYERDCNECEFINSHGTLSLQDPNGFITSRDKVEFVLDLKDVGGNLEINEGKTRWDGSLGEDDVDARLAVMVKGKCGYAIVYYSIYVRAIQVVVEATLLFKDHSHANENVCVLGRFSTRSGLSDFSIDSFKKYYETILYHKPVSKACTCKQVQSGKAFKLKLSKTRVNVRLMESLIILAELKNCDGKPIVTGSIELLYEQLSDFEEFIQGHSDDSHLLQLKVKRIV